ncbi:MAG: N-acetyl-alpha-D-glucosaminyl L-malate synthase BshA [Flavobacteriaceae bacterium]|nr:N-acetyl-alpha-D-glucosaminyl L-malate synthase BshA [Flavobacteriaceae bacterium]
MRIAIVCYPTFGGSGVVATELGMALAHKGHDVHFVTYKQPVRLQLLHKNIHFHEVHVPTYPLFKFQPYELALSSKLVNTILKNKIELVHVHYAIPHAYAAYMAKQMLLEHGVKIPIVTTLHGTDITLVGSHPFYKPAANFSINASDVVTAVSKSLQEDTLTHFEVKNEIRVIPNFIDFSLYKDDYTDCERDVMANENEKIITHVSNMRPVKRLTDVIDTYYQIQLKIPSVLLLVGDGDDREKAYHRARYLGIQEKVKFLGKTNEVDKILCFSDLFLLPSEKESFGLAALEAMANKTPVIASNTGGLPEVVQHGYNGYMADVGDVEAMSQWAIQLLGNEEKLQKFKMQAFETAKKFDLTHILPMYETAYQDALSKI